MAHQKDPADWKIKRYRSGDDHVQACPMQRGYATSAPHINVHHIVTISSMSDGSISAQLNDDPEKVDFIIKCLKKTKWDINAAGNLVRLPMKEVWRDTLSPPGWDKWPCHQVDHHPKYNQEVKIYLTKNVWEQAFEAAKECNLRGKSLAAALRTSANTLFGKLKSRGQRNGGTQYCWDSLDLPANQWRPGTNAADWFHPFSMADDPSQRSPPVKKPSTGMAAYVQRMFTMF